jgi:U2-associated protein SR140
MMLEPSRRIHENAEHLLAQVSNLYIGNLAQEVTIEMLTKIFNRFGEIQSVKLMLPRNEEECRRRRNCAFVKFATYESAFNAKEFLQEKPLMSNGMKICWGKDVSKQLRA